jgi:hypothetical protein
MGEEEVASGKKQNRSEDRPLQKRGRTAEASLNSNGE